MGEKVSIIIPVYNVECYITDCIKSVNRQTYSNIEIILVDDCGSDNSMEVAEAYLSSCPIEYKVVKHSHNRGLSAARNSGLRVATGQYVYFLDSDDEITPSCIESLVQPLNEQKYDVVVGGYKELSQASLTTEYNFAESRAIRHNVLSSYANGEWYVMAWNKLCNKSFLIDNQLFFEEGVLHEDVLWTFKVATTASAIYLKNDVTYLYKIRPSSIMTSLSIDRDVQIYKEVFDRIVAFAVKNRQQIDASAAYRYIEGKKTGILYSLLQIEQDSLYDKYYEQFYAQRYILPLKAFSAKVIGLGYLLRDLHYHLPMSIGRLYKRFFYMLYYRLRGRKIDGALWIS